MTRSTLNRSLRTSPRAYALRSFQGGTAVSDRVVANTKMKDGRTHLAHKAEHAVDVETGAIVAVTLNGAHEGDTKTIQTTVAEGASALPRW
jgi:hypothetical protein